MQKNEPLLSYYATGNSTQSIVIHINRLLQNVITATGFENHVTIIIVHVA